jgi:hypothetical protein
MHGWDQLGAEERVERLREVLEAVLKDLHYAAGMPSAQKLRLLEKDDARPRLP